MRAFGRFLQLAALVLLPVGLLLGAEGGPNAMAYEFGILALGGLVFLAGLQLQRR